MSTKADFKYTRKLFDDAIALKEPDRVPILANAFSWPIVQSKYKLSEAFKDYDKLFEIYYNFAKDYYHDAIYDVGGRNLFKCLDILGVSGEYSFNDESGYINHIEAVHLQPEEYDDFIKDARSFITEKLLPRRMKNLNGSKQEMKQVLKDAMTEFSAMRQYFQRITAALAELGVLKVGRTGVKPYAELWVSNVRGLKGTLTDLRRCPDKVEAAFEQLNNNFMFGNYDVPMKLTPPPQIPPAMDIQIPIIAGYMLNKEQVRKYYFPLIKEVVNRAAVDKFTVNIFAEGNVEHFYEFFLELPKGVVNIHFEKDDLKKAKKILGNNCCITGGIPVDMLNSGTKEQCIEYTKRLLDELAPGGGFIFSEDKMMSFKTDGKPENLRAVTEYVRLNGKY